jgi:hypothetical protein
MKNLSFLLFSLIGCQFIYYGSGTPNDGKGATKSPTIQPSALPSFGPTAAPFDATIAPSAAPTVAATAPPTVAPTTAAPVVAPTTAAPVVAPTTAAPNVAPTTAAPNVAPNVAPTTAAPNVAPAVAPNVAPAVAPNVAPYVAPNVPPTPGVQCAYGQCGGIGWTGPTVCVSGFCCVKGNDYYYQCVPTPTGPTGGDHDSDRGGHGSGSDGHDDHGSDSDRGSHGSGSDGHDDHGSDHDRSHPTGVGSQKPSPVNPGGIQSAYGQCGGIGWAGPTHCVSGFCCVKGNDYYYQCVPTPTAPTGAVSQKPSPVNPGGIQSAYGQCGGIGWTGATHCVSGFCCVKGNDYYYQCIPTPTAPTAGIQSAYGQCGGIGWTGPTNCVSGYCCVKGNDYYSQCVPTPTGSVHPRPSPHHSKPSSHNPKPSPQIPGGIQSAYGQCGGIGWTGPTHCVSGNSCVKGNDWYFQCLPTPAASVTNRPSHAGLQCPYGQCGGIGWTGLSHCESGCSCVKCNDHYHHCVPHTTVTRSLRNGYSEPLPDDLAV